MALEGSENQADVLLPAGWNGANPTSTSLFTLDSLELHLISGSQFAPSLMQLAHCGNRHTANSSPVQATLVTLMVEIPFMTTSYF